MKRDAPPVDGRELSVCVGRRRRRRRRLVDEGRLRGTLLCDVRESCEGGEFVEWEIGGGYIESSDYDARYVVFCVRLWNCLIITSAFAFVVSCNRESCGALR